jgi:hypothetical protein
MMRRTSPTATVTAAVIAVVFLASLASCSSDSSDGSSAEARPSGSGSQASASDPAPTPTQSTTPSPSPTGPCADGTCELKVVVGDIVAVPEKYGLGPIEVTAITGDEVEMVAPLTGSGYSVTGCSGGGGASSDGGGGVGLRCAEGPAATINGTMSLKVVDVRGKAAVLRIEPAG